MAHRVFISYHHENDQIFKEHLVKVGTSYGIFVDGSVDTGDIDDNLPSETVRQKIRDEYLKDTTVTIVLVGEETKNRKHVDWEIYSSMFDGKQNKRSGVIAVNLPIIANTNVSAQHGEDEKQSVYPGYLNWFTISSWEEYKNLYPYMPARIIDNLVNPQAFISVTSWDFVIQLRNLTNLIEFAFRDRYKCKYDMSRPLRRQNG